MEPSLRMRRILYRRFAVYLPNKLNSAYLQIEAAESSALQSGTPGLILKVTETDAYLNSIWRFVSAKSALVYAIWAAAVIVTRSRESSQWSFFILVAVEVTLLLVAIIRFRWRANRSTADKITILNLFFLVCFLERNASNWTDPRFRWAVAKRLELIARRVERIPFSAKSLAPSIRKEAFRLGMAKAQAIRELEFWAVRPMEFTYTDLIYRLGLDLELIIDGKWYDLPEGDHFEIKRSKWVSTLMISAAVLILGTLIFVVAFSAKNNNPAIPIIAAILPVISLALFSGAGVPVGMIDQYLQIGNKILPKR